MVANTDEVLGECSNYKLQYRNLKRKLKFLIYENECFREELRSAQQRLLKAGRDCSFLLDRLLQYEKVDLSSSDSEETESSDDGGGSNTTSGAVSCVDSVRFESSGKRKKVDGSNSHGNTSSHNVTHSSSSRPLTSTSKRKRPTPASRVPKHSSSSNSISNPTGASNSSVGNMHQVIMPRIHSGGVGSSVSASCLLADGHMTPEEVERHLESRQCQSYLELVPEKAPPTVPTEMFSNEPSLDSESNEVGELETSPSNIGEDCVTRDIPD
ncbi:uncharacterized protein LOC124157544 [Ischnura elegans]|uniref:uncharacterized protein LOC124157544 n=1 Tax=Ischnura elegans TaxID=197161 RepID=UPI001ED88EFA|nr:uncharacterized protein LOC124157544 [Ischnura elegans]